MFITNIPRIFEDLAVSQYPNKILQVYMLIKHHFKAERKETENFS